MQDAMKINSYTLVLFWSIYETNKMVGEVTEAKYNMGQINIADSEYCGKAITTTLLMILSALLDQ